jgi:hypothetical protein
MLPNHRLELTAALRETVEAPQLSLNVRCKYLRKVVNNEAI